MGVKQYEIDTYFRNKSKKPLVKLCVVNSSFRPDWNSTPYIKKLILRGHKNANNLEGIGSMNSLEVLHIKISNMNLRLNRSVMLLKKLVYIYANVIFNGNKNSEFRSPKIAHIRVNVGYSLTNNDYHMTCYYTGHDSKKKLLNKFGCYLNEDKPFMI